MADALRVTIELAARDMASRAMNAAFNRIANQAGATAARVSKYAFETSRKAALIGGLIAAPLAFATKQAVGFEEAMAGVSKVVGAKVGSHELNLLGNSAKTAAVELGVGADNAGELMAALASGGVAKRDLYDMTVTAGKVGVAFDLAAKDAGDSFVKMRNALGITNKEAKLAADSFNFISDNDASTAAQILTYMANGGASMARTLGIAAPRAATFGSALISMGKSGEEAATIMLRFQKAIYLKNNGDMLDTYKKAGRGAAGLMAVLKTGADIKDVDKQQAYFARMGEYGTSVSQLAKSYGTLQKNMALVSKVSNYEGSVDKEFNNRNSTTKGQLNRLKAEAGVLAVDLGTVLLPVIKDLVREVAPLLRQLGGWIKANPQLTGQLVRGAAAMSAVSFAVSGISGVVGGAAKAIDVLGPSFRFATRHAGAFRAAISNRMFEGTFRIFERFPRVGTALFNLGGRFTSFGATLTRVFSGARLLGMIQGLGAAVLGITWPVAIAIAAVAAAAYLVYRNWDKLKPMFINTWRVIKNVSVGAYDTVAYYFGRAADWIMTKFKPVRDLVNWIKGAIAGIKMPAWLSGLGGSIGRGLSNAANNTAGWANDAATRRGIDRQLTGAVGERPGDQPRRIGFSGAPAPMLRVSAGGRNLPGPYATPTAPGGNSSTQIFAPLNVTLPPGTTASESGNFKKLLTEHASHLDKIAKENARLSKRPKM